MRKGAIRKVSEWTNSPFPSNWCTFFTEKLTLFPLLSLLLVVFCSHFPQMTLLEPKWNKRHYPRSALSPLTTKCFQSVERVFSSLFCSLCSLAAHSDSCICLIWGKPSMCCEWLLWLIICSLSLLLRSINKFHCLALSLFVPPLLAVRWPTLVCFSDLSVFALPIWDKNQTLN